VAQRDYLQGVRRSKRGPTLAVGLFCAGAIVAIAGLATMHFSAITAGVLAIVGGWIVAAGTAPDPHDRSSEGRDDVRA
jgi:hypothetical protein